jgi:hypothetical protein
VGHAARRQRADADRARSAGPFLQRQRWFGARRAGSLGAIRDWGLLRRGAQPLFVTIVDVDYEDGERDSYFLPLAICAAADEARHRRASPHAVLARVTGARKGVLFDAWLDNGFGRALLEMFERQQDDPLAARRAGAGADQRICACRGDGPLDVGRCPASRATRPSCTANRLILKLFRRLQPASTPTSRSAVS